MPVVSVLRYAEQPDPTPTTRKDILGAVFQTATVPDVTSMKVDVARDTARSFGFAVAVHPSTGKGDTVLKQSPEHGASARRGDVIHVDVNP